MNGVIETSTGDLLRAGYSDFENDGSFNSETESYRTDVPEDAVEKDPYKLNQYSRWNGSAWETVNSELDVNKAKRKAEIDRKTQQLIEKNGFTFDGETFDLDIDSQKNFLSLKALQSLFTWPVSITTRADTEYQLAEEDVDALVGTAMAIVKAYYDSGRDLKISIDAVEDPGGQAALDDIVDDRI